MKALVKRAFGPFEIMNVKVHADMKHTVSAMDGKTLCHLSTDYPSYAIRVPGFFGTKLEPLILIREGSLVPMEVDDETMHDVMYDPGLWDKTVMTGAMTAHWRLNKQPPDMSKFMPLIIIAVVAVIGIIVAVMVLRGG